MKQQFVAVERPGEPRKAEQPLPLFPEPSLWRGLCSPRTAGGARPAGHRVCGRSDQRRPRGAPPGRHTHLAPRRRGAAGGARGRSCSPGPAARRGGPAAAARRAARCPAPGSCCPRSCAAGRSAARRGWFGLSVGPSGSQEPAAVWDSPAELVPSGRWCERAAECPDIGPAHLWPRHRLLPRLPRRRSPAPAAVPAPAGGCRGSLAALPGGAAAAAGSRNGNAFHRSLALAVGSSAADRLSLSPGDRPPVWVQGAAPSSSLLARRTAPLPRPPLPAAAGRPGPPLPSPEAGAVRRRDRAACALGVSAERPAAAGSNELAVKAAVKSCFVLFYRGFDLSKQERSASGEDRCRRALPDAVPGHRRKHASLGVSFILDLLLLRRSGPRHMYAACGCS